ncbi:unnamed protein product [marine sediment metagenome]|uniref:Uncharacterized protein n=1 Tax=marine sediment metagenome TaxID=412755 RepID=X0SFR5_9ZZZZ
MKKEPDWESMVLGRTQAIDFIGGLMEEWRKMAEQYRVIYKTGLAECYEECAEMLETKIEDFSRT